MRLILTRTERQWQTGGTEAQQQSSDTAAGLFLGLPAQLFGLGEISFGFDLVADLQKALPNCEFEH